MDIHRITAMVPITDLVQSINFYSQGLGLQVIFRKDEWDHACLEGEHGCQVMLDRSIRTDSNASTVVYYHTSNIELVRERLIAAGYEPDAIDTTEPPGAPGSTVRKPIAIRRLLNEPPR